MQLCRMRVLSTTAYVLFGGPEGLNAEAACSLLSSQDTRAMMSKLCALFALLAASEVVAKQPPHIFFVVVDDFGWAEVGYHRAEPTPEVVTPTIDSLVHLMPKKLRSSPAGAAGPTCTSWAPLGAHFGAKFAPSSA